MPALPWTSVAEPKPDQEYVVMASRLPLAHYRHIPSFLVVASEFECSGEVLKNSPVSVQTKL